MIKFTKMHGAGNDYIYVYTPEYPIADPAAASIEWSKPHFGIGSDGLILIGKSDVADFSMHIYNNDGSEAMMCGNGTRCVGKFVYDKGYTDKTVVTLETLSGIKIIHLHLGADGKVASATVDMGEPILKNPKQCATADGGKGINSVGLVTVKAGSVSVVTNGVKYSSGGHSSRARGVTADTGLTVSGGTLRVRSADDAVYTPASITLTSGALHAFSTSGNALTGTLNQQGGWLAETTK